MADRLHHRTGVRQGFDSEGDHRGPAQRQGHRCGRDRRANHAADRHEQSFTAVGDPAPGGGTVQIKNLASGLCLAVAGGRTDNLAPVYQWSCSTQPHFSWNVRETAAGYQEIVASHSGKCLNVAGLGTEDGVGLLQYTCSDVGNMQFTVRPVK